MAAKTRKGRSTAKASAEAEGAPPDPVAASAPHAPVDLVDQLHAAARTFAGDDEQVARIVRAMAEDVTRARACKLPIFPVIHHSPASAVHMVRHLREKQPRLVLMEMCEDMRPAIEGLADCKLPVALQAFAAESDTLPPQWMPASVVAPLTEFSAELQAIAYALQSGAELVFVDRSVDHVFQMRDPNDDPNHPEEDLDIDEDDEEESARLHGSAIGLEVGQFAPTFREFRDFLLHNARMGRFDEWMSLYIEEPTIGASTETYREVLFLVGSLFRRLGSTRHHREEIRLRDRYMWTRIKEALHRTGIPPEEAVFICGAAHSACDEVPEWGIDNDLRYEIPERTSTRWQYGFIPSSYSAIEAQFGHGRGAIALAEARWLKARESTGLSSFALGAPGKGAKKGKSKAAEALPEPSAPISLSKLLGEPPGLLAADEDELLHWCAGIVDAARKSQYLASTADAIAIYETTVLLARMRARNRPAPSDFVDAAEACLEKGAPPAKNNIRTLAAKMLGGDRVGQVGYSSLPPLVQDVYDRLAPIGITAKMSRVTRALMDFTKKPELRAISALLWRLRWLMPNSSAVEPIMGELKLGATPSQESWDIRLFGGGQTQVIQLAYEGLTVESVLERRFRDAAFGPDASVVRALEAAESSLILLDNPRLTESIGHHAVVLLRQERGAEHASAIFDRIRRLVHYFRSTPEGPPAWLNSFVAEGYQHYTTQLPEAFQDRGVAPEALSAMLCFVFTLEGLALAMGCSRSQLVISLELAATQTADPEKLGLLWAAQWLVQLKDEAAVRAALTDVLDHPIGRTAYPRYLSGFLLALSFAPRASILAVDLLGRAFAELPDHVLLPFMPTLVDRLRPRMADAMPALFQEFSRSAPRSLADLDKWAPPWSRPPASARAAAKQTAAKEPSQRVAATRALSEDASKARALLFSRREATAAHAMALGFGESWLEVDAAPQEILARAPEATEGGESGSDVFEPNPDALAARALLGRYPEPAAAWAAALGL